MQLKLAFAIGILLLVPAVSAAQERDQPPIAQVGRSPQFGLRADAVAPPDTTKKSAGGGAEVRDDADVIRGPKFPDPVEGEPGLTIGAGFDDGRGHVTAYRTRGRYSAATVRGLAVTARSGSSDRILRTTTDGEGRFAFVNLAPGDYVLEIAEPGTTVRDGATLQLDLVVSPNGLVIPDPESSPAGRIGAIAVDPSDPSGNVVFLPGATGGVWKSTSFPTVELTTEVTERGVALQGKVSEDQNPRPTNRACVSGRVTNAQGQPETACPADVLLSDGGTGQEPSTRGHFRTRGRHSSATVRGLAVTARPISSDAVLQTSTDDEGEFAFRNLAPGQYVLEFAQPRDIPGAEMKIVVNPINDASRSRNVSTITYTGLEMAWNPNVELTMEVTERQNILAGRVTNETTDKDCTGPPRSGVTLNAQQGNDQLRAGESIPGVDIIVKRDVGIMFQTTTDAAGAFSFANLAPGEYVLQFASPVTTLGTEFVVTESGTAVFGQAVTFVALKPQVELTMEDTPRGNVLRGSLTLGSDDPEGNLGSRDRVTCGAGRDRVTADKDN